MTLPLTVNRSSYKVILNMVLIKTEVALKKQPRHII